MDPIQAAEQSASQGRIAEAVALLTAAGDAGNAAALVELAFWYIAATRLPRDLPAARALLRRAAKLGDADAALTEIALTANGSGAEPDWPGAVKLLERAARADTLAAQHLELLRAMPLYPNGTPRSLPNPETLSQSPKIQRFPALCTPAEAVHIASVAAQSLQPAAVFDPASGRMIPHPIRTSDNAPIGPVDESLVVQAINRRIAAATGTAAGQGEPLTGLRYAPGQQYRPHLDTLPDPRNQRVLTAILYLNDSYAGGETVFPLLDLGIKARTGDLLVFENVDAEGAPEPRSRHAGLPVTAGQKWIATRWIRARPVTPWQLSEEARASGGG